MRDNSTGDSVDIRVGAECGPYIMIEPAKIARVEELLRKNGIAFTVENGPDSCKGAPEAAVIEFGKEADVERIQRVLGGVG
jgi:hypothetical protein